MRAVLSLFHHGYNLADYRGVLRSAGRPRRAGRYFAERTAGWALLTALTARAFEVAGSEGAALLILAFVLPRALLSGFDLSAFADRLGWWVYALPLPFALALLFTASDAQPALLVLLALPLGVLNVLSERALQARIDRAELAVAGALLGRIEQLGVIVGALLAALALQTGSVSAAVGLATALLLVSALLAWPERSRVAGPPVQPAASAAVPSAGDFNGQVFGLLVFGLFTGALAAMATRAALIGHVVDGLGHTATIYACLLAVVGVGALVGPLSMPKLLSHVPAALTVSLLTAALGCAVIALSRAAPLPMLAAVLFAVGLLSITLDLVAGTLSRRVAPAQQLGTTALLLTRAVLAGQMVGLLGTLALARFLNAGDVLLATGLLCVPASAAALVLAPRLGWDRLAVRS